MTDMTLPHDAAWLSAQYNNRARVPEAPALLARWAADSARARQAMAGELDVPYGPLPSERLDIFVPPARPATSASRRPATGKPADGAGRPVLLFIHGGYWRSLDKSDHSFVASDFVRDGAVVVVPNYGLCPAVRIDDIAMQMARAVAWAWRHIHRWGGDRRRLVVAGHSAGGHLAAMMLACNWSALDANLPRDLLRSALSLSGLFDLEPIRRTDFLQSDLRLTPASVRRLSPVCFSAPSGATLHALVGALESEEFLRQNTLLREHWGHAVVPVCESVAGMDHFSVLDSLAQAGGQVHARARELLGRLPA
jgi:arylformamidase